MKQIVRIALAFVGLLVGAGMATGQETIQYFLSFGTDGIWGVILAGVIMAVSGLVVLQLGSYYQAVDHSSVFASLTHKAVSRILDVCVTITVFSLGFVMLAGAGSTLAQQFGWPAWIGSALMLALVLLTGLLDIRKVTGVIGYLTPVIVVAIVGAFAFSLTRLPVDVEMINALARLEPSPITPWWLASLNYAGLVLISAVSMVLVIGGSYYSPRVAGWGGFLGGFTLTVLILLLALALLISFDHVVGAPVPTLELFNSIGPLFGTIMVWVIYLMIFSTCVGQYYSLARRLSVKRPNRFYLFFAGAAVLGFIISFVGFQDLMSVAYPVLGYLGLFLAIVLAVGYLRERSQLALESDRRIQIRALFMRQIHPGQTFTQAHAHELGRLLTESTIEEADMRVAAAREVMTELESDDAVDYTWSEGTPHPSDELTAEAIESLPDAEPEAGPDEARPRS
jgi:uncharacterized membrane protein YkvI